MDGSIWIFGVIALLALAFLILKAIGGGASATDVSSAVDVGSSGSDMSEAFLSAVPQKFVVFDLETTSTPRDN